MTDLPNRTAFNAALASTLANAKANGKILAMMCVDLDRFKEVNDECCNKIQGYGRPAPIERYRRLVGPKPTVEALAS